MSRRHPPVGGHRPVRADVHGLRRVRLGERRPPDRRTPRRVARPRQPDRSARPTDRTPRARFGFDRVGYQRSTRIAPARTRRRCSRRVLRRLQMAGIAIITEACIDGQGPRLRRCLPGPVHLRVRPGDEPTALRGGRRQRHDRELAHARTRKRSRSSATASCTSTSTSAPRARPAISPTSVRSARSMPRSTYRTARRRGSTTPRIRTPATTTRTSSSTAAKSSPTEVPETVEIRG